MTVCKITPSTAPNPHTRQPAAHTRPVEEEQPANRALVPLERTIQTSPLRTVRPDATFVAHLIAMAEQAPQTRPLRRTTPADARVVYDRARLRSAAASYGAVLSQTA